MIILQKHSVLRSTFPHPNLFIMMSHTIVVRSKSFSPILLRKKEVYSAFRLLGGNKLVTAALLRFIAEILE